MKTKLITIFTAIFMAIFLCGYVLPGHSDEDELKVMSKIDMSSILHQAPTLNPDLLELALRAYYRAQQAGLAKKPYVVIIDFTIASAKERFWLIDIKNEKVLYTEPVAHGKGSGYDFAKKFSNVPETDESSIGIYLTGQTYIGKHGTSLRLYGLDQGFDTNAYKRTIVIHPAWYVDDAFIRKNGYAGRSWGCPALDEAHAEKIISIIKDGVIIMAFYPDENWLRSSKFINPEHKSLVFDSFSGWQLI